jgi:hypothetical protein
MSCRQHERSCSIQEDLNTQLNKSSETSENRSEYYQQEFRQDDPQIAETERYGPASAIIVETTVAEDIGVVEKHLTNLKHDRILPTPFRSLTSKANNTVMYVNVPASRKGLKTSSDTGRGYLEVIQQILGPLHSHVMVLYLQHVHTFFPVLDTASVNAIQNGNLENINTVLRCVLYAIAVPYWKLSEVLKPHPQPDSHYIWNQATSAINQDFFLSPSIDTIISAVIDLIGRPSTSILGNIMTAGRTIALARAFGLHYDPTFWEISSEEKQMRIQLWWGVYINDCWSSLAYGTPPNIAVSHFDVPLPIPKTDVECSISINQGNNFSFISLCSITQILGETLSYVYRLKERTDAHVLDLKKLEAKLNILEPTHSIQECVIDTNCERITSNTWFCFLSTKLVLHRVKLRSLSSFNHSKQIMISEKAEEHKYVIKLALRLIELILGLTEEHFHDFWLPYMSHILISATMILLRASLEDKDQETRNNILHKLKSLKDHLNIAQKSYEWDLADLFLERCSSAIDILTDRTNQQTSQLGYPSSHNEDTGLDQNYDFQDELNRLFPDLFSNNDPLAVSLDPFYNNANQDSDFFS